MRTAFRTPNSEFYRVDTALVIPRVSVDGWKLTIDGAVDKLERQLTDFKEKTRNKKGRTPMAG